MADSIFACIGIGSETSGGIRDVWIKDCKFTGAKTYAIYIKSRRGRGAFIENIFADGLEVSNCTGGFLRLNMTGSGIQDQDPVPGDEGIPTARNWRFSNAGDGARSAQAARRVVADQHHRHLQGGHLPGARAARRAARYPRDGVHRRAAEHDRCHRQRIGERKAVPGTHAAGRCSGTRDALQVTLGEAVVSGR
jgi:hypothetical protein